MLLTDVWMLDGFLVRHPPVDLLVAGWMGHKSVAANGKPDRRSAIKTNTEAFAALPPRKKVRTIDQMPAFLRTPEQLKMIAGAKAEWEGATNG